MKTCCLNCGYCIKTENGYYCNDLDFEVDPYDSSPCSEENRNS